MPSPLAAAAPLLLAGLLPLTQEAQARCPGSGRWTFPVGDPRDFARLGLEAPARELRTLARRRQPPSAAEACLALAGLASN